MSVWDDPRFTGLEGLAMEQVALDLTIRRVQGQPKPAKNLVPGALADARSGGKAGRHKIGTSPTSRRPKGKRRKAKRK